jgi:pentalenene oxygenase
MHSVVQFNIPRIAVTDVEVMGHKLPRGTIFLPYPAAVHASSDYYKHPELYNPDRWDTDKALPYIPFGDGP